MSIEAMKQALEALELMVTPRNFQTHQFCQKAYDDLCQAISEAEKQDVEQSSTESKETFDQPVAVVDSTISGHIDWLCVVFPKQGTKLYTTPQPQREWVGLTDEETDHLFNMYERSSFGLVRAVEAKLKEKNT